MTSVAVKFYSLFFKTLLKHKLLNHSSPNIKDGYAPVSRPSKGVPANASFVDGVATKDINIDPLTTLTLRIFLPESALPQELITQGNTGLFGHIKREDKDAEARAPPQTIDHETRRSSYGGDARNGNKREDKDAEARAPPQTIDHETRRSSYGGDARNRNNAGENRRSSWGGELLRKPCGRQDYARLDVARPVIDEGNQLVEAILDADPSSSGHSEASGWQDSINNFAKPSEAAHDRRDGSRRDSLNYQGYIPDFTAEGHKKLPIIVQFHGGGFVTGSKDSAANDIFCRRMAKLCDAIVIAVGYRLALEHKYPAAFDDGFEALCWLAKQANLADCSKSLGQTLPGLLSNRSNIHRQNHKELIDTFGGSTIVESWLAAHGDPSRCVLLGVSSGANIADFVARKAVQAGKLLEPIKVVAQVLMYPFFIGSVPTHSEIKLANSYFYDKSACILAWKLFFSDGEFTLDHPVANPLVAGREPPLKHMPPTLTVVGELDWMKDRAIAYSESLRKVNLDAPVLEYKDAVHEFATLDFLVKSRQAEACAEDMTIWIKKYISQKGHEFSY